MNFDTVTARVELRVRGVVIREIATFPAAADAVREAKRLAKRLALPAGAALVAVRSALRVVSTGRTLRELPAVESDLWTSAAVPAA